MATPGMAITTTSASTVFCCFHCNIAAHPKCLDADPDSKYVNAEGECEWVCADCHGEYGY